MATPPVIECRDLGKAYRRFPGAWSRLVETLSLGSLTRHEPFWALRHVDLALPRGAALGLVGPNGAGKSTLLRLLSRTSAPSEGRFRIDGCVASLLELGSGFQRDFTGRENVHLAGTLLGLSRRELRAREGEILEFAGLREFADEPLRTYSTGMALRLGFAVAMAVDPDVLILDEVLAVGDLTFQKRCIEHVLGLRERGRTLVFCSHSLYDVRQLCDQALWLERGRVQLAGDPGQVTQAYASHQREHVEHDAHWRGRLAAEAAARGSELPSLVAARLVDPASGEACARLESGAALDVRVWWRNPTPDPIQLGVAFLRQDRTLCAGTGTHLDGVTLAGSAGCAVLHLPALELLAGQFLVLVVLFDGAGVHRWQELLVDPNLEVRADSREVGLVRLRHAWRKADEPPPAAAQGEAA